MGVVVHEQETEGATSVLNLSISYRGLGRELPRRGSDADVTLLVRIAECRRRGVPSVAAALRVLASV